MRGPAYSFPAVVTAIAGPKHDPRTRPGSPGHMPCGYLRTAVRASSVVATQAMRKDLTRVLHKEASELSAYRTMLSRAQTLLACVLGFIVAVGILANFKLTATVFVGLSTAFFSSNTSTVRLCASTTLRMVKAVTNANLSRGTVRSTTLSSPSSSCTRRNSFSSRRSWCFQYSGRLIYRSSWASTTEASPHPMTSTGAGPTGSKLRPRHQGKSGPPRPRLPKPRPPTGDARRPSARGNAEHVHRRLPTLACCVP